MPTEEEVDVITKCGRPRLSATIVSLETGEHWKTRFVEATQDSVVLERLTGGDVTPTGSAIRRSSLYTVIFGYGAQTHAVLATVTDYDRYKRPPRLRLQLVSPISSAQARPDFCIPRIDKTPLCVELVSGANQVWTPVPVDIGYSGIQVRFPKHTDPNLPIDTSLRVRLQLEHHNIELTGAVMRRKGHCYTVRFLVHETEEPPATLRSLICYLKDHWLQRRIVD